MYFFIFVVIQGGLSFFTVKYLFGIVLFAASKIVFVIVLVMISMFIVSEDSIPVNNRKEISVRFIVPFVVKEYFPLK